jgi:metal-responsive CopG/Arc/MetJ family transcriptional regulator
MKTVTVKLPSALNARLERAAKQGGQTKSGVVREALEGLLGGRRRTRPARSALELAGDLVGSIEGPGDLSTNPKHLEGLGE